MQTQDLLCSRLREAILVPANTILHSLVRMEVPEEDAVLYVVAYREISV